MSCPTSYVLHRNLATDPETIVRAKGSYLYVSDDKNGQERAILDACGGAAVVSIGHANEIVVDAISRQLSTLHYCHSGAFTTHQVEELAALLCKSGGYNRCFFASGGSEAVESAIKLARQYQVEKGDTQRTHFISREGSYHGNLLGGLSLSGHVARRAPYLPLFSDKFHHVSGCYSYREKGEKETTKEYVNRLANELEEKIIEIGADQVAAFIAEPVVGAARGCVPSVDGYFAAIREVCDKYGVLLIMDEIMCGMGRTGKLHAWQHFNVQPDIQVVAKGLSGGYAPCSAVLATEKVTSVLKSGTGKFNNGFTFQNWTIGAVAALEVQKYIQEKKLVEAAAQKGQLLERELKDKLGDHKYVGDIRGQGLFWAIEIVQDGNTKTPFEPVVGASEIIFERAKELGIMVYPGSGTVDGIKGDHVLVAPPYNIKEDEVILIATVLRQAVDFFTESVSART